MYVTSIKIDVIILTQKKMNDKKVAFDQIIELFKESFSFVKLYKILLVFGIIFVMFGGTISGVNTGSLNSSNFKSNYNNIKKYDKPILENNKYRNSIVDVAEFIQDNYLIIIPTVCCVALVWLALSTYLRNVSRNVLISAVDLADKKYDMSFKSLWKYGHSHVLKTFALEVIYSIASLILGVLSIPLIFFCGLGIITLIVGSVCLGILLDLSKRYLLIGGKSIEDSIKDAVDLLKNNIVNFILYWVAKFLISIVLAVVSFLMVFLFLFVIIMVVVVFGLFFPLGIVFAIIAAFIVFVLAIMVMSFIMSLIQGPVLAVIEVWKTKYWKLLVSEK